MAYRSLITCMLVAFVLSSCKRDMPEDPTGPAPVEATYSPGEGVFVTNEGMFQSGNSSVTFYAFNDSFLVSDAYQQANGTVLGDICQSMTVINGLGYVVVNNSGKIAVVNMSDFSLHTTITGFDSPRYITAVSSTKAYVSDLYGDGLRIVDLTTNTITGEIPMPGWTERMLFTSGRLYVTCFESNKVYVVDPVADTLMDSVSVSIGGNSIVEGTNGDLWVLCSGDIVTAVPGALYRFNSGGNTVQWSATFPAGHYPSNLCINGTLDELYYVDEDVQRMSVTAAALPSSPFIGANGRYLYGLAVHPSGDIYVSDAMGFTQAGSVYRYSAAGVLLDDFTAGIGPGNFCFY